MHEGDSDLQLAKHGKDRPIRIQGSSFIQQIGGYVRGIDYDDVFTEHVETKEVRTYREDDVQSSPELRDEISMLTIFLTPLFVGHPRVLLGSIKQVTEDREPGRSRRVR